MTDLLTRQGARNFTQALDRVATVVQNRHAVLGLPQDVALDFAKRCDLISDASELTASANFPLKEGAEVDQVPAQAADPDVTGVTDSQGGTTDDTPESSDQNKPETYENTSAKVAEDDEDEAADADKEAADKQATPEFAQPAKNETGESVEPGGSAAPHWDANAIGDDRGGPYKADADEGYMAGEFAQKQFHELRDKQQSGLLPQVDAKLASLMDGDEEGLKALAMEMRKLTAAPASDITRMPGFSPKQLRDKINEIAQLRQQITMITAQYEDVLKQMEGLEKEEKAGLAELKKAASEMRDKGKYLATSEEALLQFTAYITNKVPGIDQMIARGEEYKGKKAGDFFGRIAAQLGDDIAESVQEIYEATKEDLTHTTMAVRGLKIVAKTASFNDAQLKTAGIVDTVVSIKEWIAGQTDAMASRILGFAGNISKWVRGFTERTKIVGKNTKTLTGSLADARKAVDGALAQAGRIASDEDEGKQASDGNDWGFNLTN